MEIRVYQCCITWARTYLLKKIVCIPEHDMSRGNSLTGIPSSAGSSGRSLFHHSQEALAFTCFFCLSVIPFIAASHINDATAEGIRRWKQIEPGFLWDCFSIQEQRCYVFSLCSSALIKFQAFYVLIWLCHLVAMLWWWSKWVNLRMDCKQTDLSSHCMGCSAR